jgi:hypothetical protein
VGVPSTTAAADGTGGMTAMTRSTSGADAGNCQSAAAGAQCPPLQRATGPRCSAPACFGAPPRSFEGSVLECHAGGCQRARGARSRSGRRVIAGSRGGHLPRRRSCRPRICLPSDKGDGREPGCPVCSTCPHAATSLRRCGIRCRVPRSSSRCWTREWARQTWPAAKRPQEEMPKDRRDGSA